MSSFKSSSRYNSFDNRSSTQSDPSSSTELKQIKNRHQTTDVSYQLAKSKSSKNEHQLSAMVKKFMEKRSSGSSKVKGREFVLAADVTSIIADDLKKKAAVGGRRGGASGIGGLHKKLFGSKVKGEETERKKALPEVKARTLAMVLRSERELLSQNKDQETEIIELRSTLEDKNREVDKLKDLCLKQREEIKALKSAILFPDVTNSQLQCFSDEHDSELKHAKYIIPTLQRQVTSLTGQLQCLADDLAEVKATKYSATGFYDSLVSSPKTPTYEQEEALNSLEFSSGDHTTNDSADELFLKDLNPCLTPFSKSNSNEFEATGSKSPIVKNSSYSKLITVRDAAFISNGGTRSKSSDYHPAASGRNLGRRSNESKCTYGR